MKSFIPRPIRALLGHPVSQASALRVAAVVVGLTGSVAMARLGGPEIKGVAAAYAATNTLVFTIVNFDFAQQVLRRSRLTSRVTDSAPLLLSGWTLYVLLATVAGGLGSLLSPNLIWISVGALSYLLSAQAGVAAVGLSGARVTALAAVIQQLALLAGILVLHSEDLLTPSGARLTIVLSYLASLPLFFRVLVSHGGLSRRRAPWSSALHLAAGGIGWQLGRMAQFGLLRLDVVLLFHLAGPRSAGIYSVALSLGALAQLIPAQMASDAYFRATRGRLTNPQKSVRHALIVSILGALVIASVGYPLLIMLYGSVFAAAYIPLLASLPGAVAYSVLQVQTALTRVYGTWQELAVSNVPAVILMVTSLPLLIDAAGMTGAACASSLGAITAAVSSLLVTRSRASATVTVPAM